ncbi:mercuric transporter MerT family protein [Thermodesulfobacteriota bacterium]
MKTDKKQIIQKRGRWGLIGAIVSVIAASLCCVGPLVLLALGVSGAWMGSMTVLEPYRPLFMILVFGFLGTAFYRIYRKPKEESCEEEACCASPRQDRLNKAALWTVTVLVLGFLALPYAVPYLSAGGDGKPAVRAGIHTKTATLGVRNMTCAACTVPVAKSLKKIDGVIEAKVSYEPPRAIVEYDPAKVRIQDMIAATTGVGYPSSVFKEGKK